MQPRRKEGLISGRGSPLTNNALTRLDPAGTIRCAANVLSLSYLSFAHAQGSQRLQVHIVQCCARMQRADGIPLHPAAFERPLALVRGRALPVDHMPIPGPQREAQFEFWWHLIRAVFRSVYADTGDALPNRATLDTWAAAADGAPEMSSFTDTEMTAIADALEMYREPAAAQLTARDVAIHGVLPVLIHVETGFQGTGAVWPSRPCTTGDRYRSRLLEHCRTAVATHRAGRAGLLDRLYLMLCEQLDQWAATATGHPTYRAYRALVDRYNANHPDGQVTRLHVPAERFTMPGTALARTADSSRAAHPEVGRE